MFVRESFDRFHIGWLRAVQLIGLTQSRTEKYSLWTGVLDVDIKSRRGAVMPIESHG